MKRLIFSTILWLICSTAFGQNIVCPTRPSLDGSNACASTKYVDSAIQGAYTNITGAITCTSGGVCSFSPIAANSILGNNSGSSAAPQALTTTQANAILTGTGICYAVNQTGTLSQRINSCITALSGNPGVVDATGLSGAQSINTAISIPSLTTVKLGAAVITQSATITLSGAGSGIIGVPAAMGIGTQQALTFIKQANTTNLSSMITLSGGYNVLQDLQIDGNYANNASTSQSVLVTGSRPAIERVTVQNGNNGIHIFSSAASPSTACCGKLKTIMAIANNNVGLLIHNNGDTFVENSEFENNGAQGVYLLNAGATRFEHNDIGGNHGICALDIEGESTGFNAWGNIVIGNQFGNNYANDFCINYSNVGYTQSNILSGNSFIGSSNRPNTSYSNIFIQNTVGNSITGNTIYSGSGHASVYGINIYSSSAGAEFDTVVGNTNTGVFGTGACGLDASVIHTGNTGGGC